MNARAHVAVVVIGAVSIVSAQSRSAPLAHSSRVVLSANVSALAAIARSSKVAAGLEDGHVVVWNGQDPSPELTIKAHAAQVLAVGSTGDGRGLWSVGVDGTLVRTPIVDGSPSDQRRIELGTERPRAAVFSPDGTVLVTGGEHGGLRVFETLSGTLARKVAAHRTEIHALAFRPGSTTLASASAEADLRTWDVSTGTAIAHIEGDLALFALAFSPRDGTLAAGGVDRKLTFRDPATLEARGTVAVQKPEMVATLAWSQDGRHIALGDLDDETLSKGGIRILDVQKREPIARLDTGGVPANAVIFTSDPTVAIGAVARHLRAWRVSALGR